MNDAVKAREWQKFLRMSDEEFDPLYWGREDFYDEYPPHRGEDWRRFYGMSEEKFYNEELWNWSVAEWGDNHKGNCTSSGCVICNEEDE